MRKKMATGATTPVQPTTGQERSVGNLDGPDPRIVQFAQLFQGRLDAVGGDDGRAIYRPYTYDAVESHLLGLEPIGVYPSWPDDSGDRWVRWGCCDIDTGDWAEAFQLATALKGMGLVPHVERSRSKGWHIWVFVREPVQAWEMRRCLKVAYAAIDLPAKEANPKSEQLAPNQLGNYVRLPYKQGLVLDDSVTRQCMMGGWNRYNDGAPLTFDTWVGMTYGGYDNINRTSLWTPRIQKYSDIDKIKHWASKWYERPRRLVDMPEPDMEKLGPLVNNLDASWRRFFDTGDVRDRSAAFVALAHWCAQRGWSASDTYTLLWFCPWNKYAGRQDGEVYVRDIVERAYS